MKKILLILCIFISWNTFAVFMSIDDALNCDKTSRETFEIKSKCEKKKSQACRELGKKFNCHIMVFGDVEVDTNIQLYLKENETTCSDEDDCISKFQALSCSSGFTGTYTLEPSKKAYCFKENGFVKKTVQMYKIDSAKKAAYDGPRAIKKTKRDNLKTAINAIKAKLKNQTSLTDDERDDALRHLYGTFN